MKRRNLMVVVVAVCAAALAAFVLAGCGGQPGGSGSGAASSAGAGSSQASAPASASAASAQTLVVGSQDFYENETIAEAYAQALETAGYTVERNFRIGQREVYMPEIEAGSIDVFPEYTGNLLQYYDEGTEATESQEVYDALVAALPDGLRVLDQAEATDADSYVVNKEFADEHGITSIGDLKGADDLVLAGNSELETRPYGPKGLESVYGVTVAQFKPVEDSGGPLTVKALRDGDATMVDLYSSTPELASGDLVVLEDPKGLFLASHVVPVVSQRVDEAAAAVIDAVDAALSPDELVKMNDESVNGQRSAADIAADFLTRNGLA